MFNDRRCVNFTLDGGAGAFKSNYTHGRQKFIRFRPIRSRCVLRYKDIGLITGWVFGCRDTVMQLDRLQHFQYVAPE